jgi:CubicO group peptidase (beta-lactamase class C family)
VLHLTVVDNKLTATLDSPAQGAYGLAGSNAQLNGSTFSFEVPSVHGSYTGTVSADSKAISGMWTQGKSIKLVLKQVSTGADHAQVKPSPIDGDWAGALHAGDTSLRVVFHFHAAPGGKISCSLDSLDQGAMGIACDNVKLAGQKLTLDAPPVHGAYTATLSADGTKLSGTWNQGVPLPLELTRLPKAPGASMAPPAPAPAGPPVALANLKPVLDKELAPVIAAWPQAGLVVGIAVGGERKTFAYGTAKTDSIFEIGSVTKTFTGLALAQMVEQHKVLLDEPLRELLPTGTVAKPASGAEITPLDLATQHSGLPRLPENFAEHATQADPYADYTAKDAYDYMAKHGVARPDKTEFLYSNFGFGLLGQVLADKAGESYAALIQQQITGPLAMKDTTIELSAAQQARLIQGYSGAHEKAHQWTFQSMAGAGALRSTIDDLLTYAEAYLHPDKIPAASSGPAATLPAALRLAQQPQADGPGGTKIALAWLFHPETGVYWHNGGTAGYASFVSFEPKLDRAIVVLYNCLDMNPGKPAIWSPRMSER